MTDTDIIIEIAKLDGYTFPPDEELQLALQHDPLMQYTSSRDAIIPVIEKTFNRFTAHSFIDSLGIERSEDTIDVDGKREYQGDGSYGDIWLLLIAAPKQLCIALLKSTGKWKD